MNSSTGATVRPPYASTSLYVGDLAPDVSETNLYEFFNSIGPVASIRVCRDAGSRRSLGYAYVNYHSISDAERALDTLNYTPIKGVPCRIMWSQRDPTVRKTGSGNLFVKNLDKTVDNRALHDTFSLFGNILSCKVVTDEQGKSRGFGFVHFETDEAAQQALNRVNGMKLGSKEVYVGPFHKRAERQPAKQTEYFTNTYCRSFPNSWTEAKLQEVFEQYGKVTSIWMSADKQGRPYACVNFADPNCAKAAVAGLNGRKVDKNGLLSDEAVAAAEKAAAEKAAADKAAEKQDEKAATEAAADKGASEEGAAEKSANEKAAAVKAAEDGEQKKKDEGDDENKEISAKAVDEDRKDEAEEKNEDQIYTLFVDRAQDKSERGNQNSAGARNRQQGAAPGGAGGPVGRRFDGINLYIKNLSETIDDQELRRMFEKFGKITSSKIMKSEEGTSKGFGFVCFTSADDATRAIAEMHLKVHDNKPLYVGLAEQKDRRHARLQHHFGNNRSSYGPLIHHGGLGPSALGPGGLGPAGLGPSGLGPGPSALGGPSGLGFGPNTLGLGPAGAGIGPGGMGMTGTGGSGGIHGMGMHSGQNSQSGPNPLALAHQQAYQQAYQQGGNASLSGQNQAGLTLPQTQQTAGQGQSGQTGQQGLTHQQLAQQQQQMAAQQHATAPPQGSLGFFNPQMMPAPQAAWPTGPFHQSNHVLWKMSFPPPQPLLYNPSAGYRPIAPTRQRAPETPSVSKQVLGERLFPLVSKYQPMLAGKITGMMLDMEDQELLLLIQSETELKAKIEEALRVLEQAQAIQG